MPMVWTEPELYLEHPNGVKVWHTYKGMRDYPMSSCFTTKECDDDCESGSEYVFDVFDLPEPPDMPLTKSEDVRHAARITHAINEGRLPLPPENQPSPKKSGGSGAMLSLIRDIFGSTPDPRVNDVTVEGEGDAAHLVVTVDEGHGYRSVRVDVALDVTDLGPDYLDHD